ncbi:sodium/potassium/calcium exchanger 3-like [Patiria miniata]|uniref:Sodium/calcium exchanger membrane region domain-containing protein n=1 Tax=Patiria miniata TaxID=46514 RepID=A0A914BC38_PATMI|nr:sodium/potassium/calcium exchanger 3-like [Patiria miniata]
MTMNVKCFLVAKISILCVCLVVHFSFGSLLRTAGKERTEIKEVSPGEVEEKLTGFVAIEDRIGRRLQQTEDADDKTDINCSMPAIVRFPRTMFTEKQRENGAVILNFFIAVYLFGAIAYVCINYFVPSLEIICKMLGIQEDVAGATFMAIGSSAPEFFSAVVGTFITYDNTGLGGIVGSSAFNVFVVLALCALVAGGNGGLQLSWYPVIRDTICWVISMVILIAVTYDAMVQWWEGLIMTLCFAGYITIMYFNKPISALALKWRADTKLFPCPAPQVGTPGDTETEMEETAMIDGLGMEEMGEGGGSRTSYGTSTSNYGINNPENPSSDDSDTEKSVPSVFDPPTSTSLYITWLLGLPIIVLLHYSVPDCRKSGVWRRCYPITFVASCVWLAGLSYLLYWMIVVIGYTLGVPDTVMGYTVLAIGTSVPDAVASVLVARDGFVDMAVANIIGSNIFETFICLGFVWFLKTLFSNPVGSPIMINAEGLTVTSISLMLVVLFIIVAVHNNRWKLDMKIGIIALLFYILFIAWATLNAEGAFGVALDGTGSNSAQPPCPPNVLNL